jgi:hypothetical protein
VIRAHLREPPPALASLVRGPAADGLGPLVGEMLAKDPAARPAAAVVAERLA